MRKPSYFLVAAVAGFGITAAASAGDYPQYDAAVVGGFTFRQYVNVTTGGPELLAAKGVLFIARQPFTKSEISKIREAKFGDIGLSTGEMWVRSGGANVCAAIVPMNASSGVPINYPPLAITRAQGTGSKVSITLINFPDAGFGWYVIAKGGDTVIRPYPKSRAQWRWKTTRFVVHADPKMTLEKCLQYSDAHVEEVQRDVQQAHKLQP